MKASLADYGQNLQVIPTAETNSECEEMMAYVSGGKICLRPVVSKMDRI